MNEHDKAYQRWLEQVEGQMDRRITIRNYAYGVGFLTLVVATLAGMSFGFNFMNEPDSFMVFLGVLMVFTSVYGFVYIVNRLFRRKQ